jgi:hypothetical protein
VKSLRLSAVLLTGEFIVWKKREEAESEQLRYEGTTFPNQKEGFVTQMQ